MAYKCVVRFLDSSGKLVRTLRSPVLKDGNALSYARRMGEIYPKAAVSLKYAAVSRAGILLEAR